MINKNIKAWTKLGRIHSLQMRPPRYRPLPRRPSFITPFPAPFIASYHFSSPSEIPGGLDGQKDAFSRIKKDGLWTDRRTDRRTDRPSYRDARTHLKIYMF